MTETIFPILYSFRRCPYAMRARMAIAVSGIQCKLREVVLRDKPPAMLDISPKGTVPVVKLPNGHVLEESMAVMHWALNHHDPQDWYTDETIHAPMNQLIEETETFFKGHLDRYKYPNRYDNVDPIFHRNEALKFIQKLNDQLTGRKFLFADQPRLADISIFPFIRQFANTDRSWFDRLTTINAAQAWLERCLSLAIFETVMEKYPQWHEGDEEPIFPSA